MNDCWLHITKEDCCDCPDLLDADFGRRICHWAHNFELLGWALKYVTLDAPGADSRLCRYGRCRACGKRLCADLCIPVEKSGDSFLAAAYRWMNQLWHGMGSPLPNHYQTFREMFLALFHEGDKPFISEWLARPENQNVMQMYRK